MASKLYNRARVTITSTGTGTLSLGSPVSGYQSFASAGAQNNDVVSYVIEDGLNWELGTGTFSSAANTLTRTVTQSSSGASAISVTTAAQVFISPLAADLSLTGLGGTLSVSSGGTGATTLTGVLKGNGTSAFTAATAGTDYVAPGGALGTPSSGTLTNCTFPTLNQNTTGTASNVTGTVAVANGGTGATTLTGIIKGSGTSAFTAATAGTDYVAPGGALGTPSSGNLSNCTFPTLNQNTTGTASNVTGTVAVANGGTGLTSFTSGYVPYASSTSALSFSSSIYTNGTNVGIGTSSPGTKTEIYSSGNTYLRINGNIAGGNYAGIQMIRNSGTVVAAQIDSQAEFNNDYGIMRFSTAGSGGLTEAMRISSAGNVGIGTNSPSTLLHVNGTIRYTNRPAAGTITAIGYDTNGDLKASSSSLRYKENIKSYSRGLSDILAMRPVTFNFIGEDKLNAGFIVEEIDQLGLEEFVLRNEAGDPDAIPYGNMVAILTIATQELSAKLNEAEARISQLEASK